MSRFALKRRPGWLFWLESVLAGVSAFLAVLTLVWDDWIEGVFGFDPDHGNGSFEWELVIVCCLVTAFCSVLARREWRRARLATA
jgi:hypothetical protein